MMNNQEANMLCMISLVGAQAAPNVLPLDHIKPDRLILVYTQTTQKVAENTQKLLSSEKPAMTVDTFFLEYAYDLKEICLQIGAHLEQTVSEREDLIFNLTGGTKVMSFAAIELAKRRSSRAFYYQSEENQSKIHHYNIEQGALVAGDSETIATSLSLDQYLRLYLSEYEQRHQNEEDVFENNVINALMNGLGSEFELKPRVCPLNIAGHVEIDFVVRYKNVIAVGEIKEKANKRAFEQLNSITSQEALGTYTKKFIVHTNELDKNNKDLMDAYKIVNIMLPSGKNFILSNEDRSILLDKVITTMTFRKVFP
jgi:hypothetical protein